MKVINLLRKRCRVVAKSFAVIPVVSPTTCCVHYLLLAFKSRGDQSDELLVSAGNRVQTNIDLSIATFKNTQFIVCILL